VYKIITKIVAKRLKSHKDFLVSPYQYSFVSGRHSVNNIVIAQEVFNSMRNLKGKKGIMNVKVDLDKLMID